MLTDISASSNVVYITFGGDASDKIGITQLTPVTYSFNPDGTILTLIVNNIEYQIDFSGLTIGGVAPADVAAAYTALSTVFPAAGGGGGSSLFPVTGTGTATGDVTGDLDGHTLSVQQGGQNFLLIDPTTNLEAATLQAYNTTGDGNYGYINFSTTDIAASFTLYASFNDGVKDASITANADATTATLTYTADTHQFAGNVGIGATPTADQLFLVNDGSNDLLSIDKTNFISILEATDGTAFVGLSLSASGDKYFDLNANDGSNQVDIVGYSTAQTITITAATVNISSLAGTGSRAVMADASGNLSAP